MGQFSTFDNPETKAFTLARQDFLRDFLDAAGRNTELRSALDVGCGVGDFSKFLTDRGFKVIGLDGREQNTEEARSRHREITFLTFDVENPAIKDLGSFDLVLCFGLLYHLQNPFCAVRNLHSLTAKVLLIEGICLPDSRPTMALLDEPASENQGLNYIAFYPSPSCLVKMLYRAGFPYVYGFRRPPDFHLYRASRSRKRERIALAASRLPLGLPNLIAEQEAFNLVPSPSDPWATSLGRVTNRLPTLNALIAFMRIRLPRFLKRPWSEKREIVSWYLKRRGSRT